MFLNLKIKNNYKMSSQITAPNLLFYIGRTLNKNVVVYTYNKKNKELDVSDPLSVYWIMREDPECPTENLTYIESKMAFGFKIIDKSTDFVTFTTNALPDEILTIKLNSKNKFRCFYNHPEKHTEYILKKVFVNTDDSALMPVVKSVELFLEDTYTGEITKFIKNNAS